MSHRTRRGRDVGIRVERVADETGEAERSGAGWCDRGIARIGGQTYLAVGDHVHSFIESAVVLKRRQAKEEYDLAGLHGEIAVRAEVADLGRAAVGVDRESAVAGELLVLSHGENVGSIGAGRRADVDRQRAVRTDAGVNLRYLALGKAVIDREAAAGGDIDHRGRLRVGDSRQVPEPRICE